MIFLCLGKKVINVSCPFLLLALGDGAQTRPSFSESGVLRPGPWAHILERTVVKTSSAFFSSSPSQRRGVESSGERGRSSLRNSGAVTLLTHGNSPAGRRLCILELSQQCNRPQTEPEVRRDFRRRFTRRAATKASSLPRGWLTSAGVLSSKSLQASFPSNHTGDNSRSGSTCTLLHRRQAAMPASSRAPPMCFVRASGSCEWVFVVFRIQAT